MRGSRPVRLKQTEYEWVYLFGSVCPSTGDSVGLVAPTANTELMNVHLRMISEYVAPDIHVILVLDRAGLARCQEADGAAEHYAVVPAGVFARVESD